MFGKHTRYTQRRVSRGNRRQNRTLRLERLDVRELMAGDAFDFVGAVPFISSDEYVNRTSGIVYDAQARSVIIRGTAKADFAMVTTSGDGRRVEVSLSKGTGSIDVKSFDIFRWQDIQLPTGGRVSVPVERLTERVMFEGEAGDDRFYNFTGISSVANGGAGNDRLTGGSGDDRLLGGGDHDTLVGNSGNDVLAGQAGHDLLYGGSGCDELWGDEGNDTLFGDDDVDLLYGGSGHDRLNGGDGADSLWGGTGWDVLRGDAGADKLYGDGEYDFLDPGNDPGDRSYSGLASATQSYAVPQSLLGVATINYLSKNQVSQSSQAINANIMDINATWLLARNEALSNLKASLNGREIKPGYRLHDVELFLAIQGEARIVDVDGNISIKFLLRGNGLKASVTQPTFLGDWADPRVKVSFDLEVTIPIAKGNRLASGTVQVRMITPKVEGANLIGDMVVPLYQFFTLGGLTRDVQATLNRSNAATKSFGESIKAILGELNTKVENEIHRTAQSRLPSGVTLKSNGFRVLLDAAKGQLVVVVDATI